jgi:hypothetical protein
MNIIECVNLLRDQQERTDLLAFVNSQDKGPKKINESEKINEVEVKICIFFHFLYGSWVVNSFC